MLTAVAKGGGSGMTCVEEVRRMWKEVMTCPGTATRAIMLYCIAQVSEAAVDFSMLENGI